MNAQQLVQFFATIQKTMEEAKIEIATMTEEDVPVSVDSDINPEETEEPEEQPEGGEENDV